MSNDFIISAVVPTKNRADDLLKLIESLLVQSFFPIELIVVDQSNQSNLSILQEKFVNSVISLNYFHRIDINSLVEAKAFGVSVSKGDFVCFLEDDIILDTEFFSALVQGFIEKEYMLGSCGRITNMPRSSKFFVFCQSIFFKGIFHDPRLKIFNSSDKLFLVESHMLNGGLSMWKKSVFETEEIDVLNGFFMIEDVEYSTRVAKSFPKSLYINCRANVEHKMSPKNRLEFDLRQENKIKEAILFYKKRKYWRGAIYGLSLALFWWTLDAVLESMKRMTIRPLKEHIKGLKNGIKTDLVVNNKSRD